MNVSAIIPTRGDVDIAPIIDSLPEEWEKLVWINGSEERGKERRSALAIWPSGHGDPKQYRASGLPHDLGPHARFAAIEYASHDLIYVQDDDVIVSDPQKIVDAWHDCADPISTVVCNMPLEFRDHYPDSAMVGFGAAFHRDAPARAFARMDAYVEAEVAAGRDCWAYPLFYRESCRIFTTLTPRVLVDVPKQDREMASDPSRLWKQPDHLESRARALALARAVRDSS